MYGNSFLQWWTTAQSFGTGNFSKETTGMLGELVLPNVSGHLHLKLLLYRLAYFFFYASTLKVMVCVKPNLTTSNESVNKRCQV